MNIGEWPSAAGRKDVISISLFCDIRSDRLGKRVGTGSIQLKPTVTAFRDITGAFDNVPIAFSFPYRASR